MCDYPKAYTSKNRISRKPHTCSECGGRIFYKERYHYFAAIWDDHWGTFKTCMDCVDLRSSFETGLDYEDRPPIGELVQWILEEPIWNVEFVEKYVDTCDKRGKMVHKDLRKLLRKKRK